MKSFISPAYAAEPAFDHERGINPSIGILLCNLGTPEAPTAAAVRRYLAEFLADSRVVELPRLLWWPILHGIILRVRPAKSAAKYRSIWMEQGSPLAWWTQRQAQEMEKALTPADGVVTTVRPAMRYGRPSVVQQLDALKAQGVRKMLILPAYPQYSGTTTASVVDAVAAWLQRQRNQPHMRIVRSYHDHPAYIDALTTRVQQTWQVQGRSQHLVLSFHGVPARTLEQGDPYHCECLKTARLLVEALELGKDQYTVAFQSRFGKAAWLQPYTESTLQGLAHQGVESVDVFCPGFVSDCLETLEEINQEARSAFLQAGGKAFRYIPCLNDDPAWIQALATMAWQNVQDW